MLLQTEAVGSEWKSGLCSAWGVVCSEGDSPEGGGWEAAAGAREEPTLWSAGSGEKKSECMQKCTFCLCCFLTLLWSSSSPQAESSNAELSLLLNKLQSEDAALRDSLAKMGSMNEGLAQDKADLNTYILQVQIFSLYLISEVSPKHIYYSWEPHSFISKSHFELSVLARGGEGSSSSAETGGRAREADHQRWTGAVRAGQAGAWLDPHNAAPVTAGHRAKPTGHGGRAPDSQGWET